MVAEICGYIQHIHKNMYISFFLSPKKEGKNLQEEALEKLFYQKGNYNMNSNSNKQQR